MTNSTVNRKLQYHIILMLAFFLWSIMFTPVISYASSPATGSAAKNKTDQYRDSIVRIESICWDGDNVIYQTKSFSGFVISKDTSGVYVVTANKNLTYSADEKSAIEESYKFQLQAEDASDEEENEENSYKSEPNVRISEKIEVIFSGDLRVKATVVGESEQRNLTVLKLEQSIQFDHIPKFPEKGVEHKNQITLLAYPESASDGAVYNTENVSTTEGTLLDTWKDDELEFFKHDITADAFCTGGLLLYKDGTIAGVFLTGNGDAEGTAISSDSLKTFLTTLKVPFNEHKKVIVKKKSPILNIVLGIVIFILLIITIIRAVKGNLSQTSGDEKSYPAVSKKQNRKKQSKNNTSSTQMPMVQASIEYAADKRIVMIRKSVFTIGRGRDADFVLSENKGISRKHACIRYENQNFYLSDLDSTNHTYLNNSELNPGEMRILKNGDRIGVGKEILVFYRQ